MRGHGHSIERKWELQFDLYMRWGYLVHNSVKVKCSCKNVRSVSFNNGVCEIELTANEQNTDLNNPILAEGEKGDLIRNVFKDIRGEYFDEVEMTEWPISGISPEVLERSLNQSLAFYFIDGKSEKLFVSYLISNEKKVCEYVEKILKQLACACCFARCCKDMFVNTSLNQEFQKRFQRVCLNWLVEGDYVVVSVDGGKDTRDAIAWLEHQFSCFTEQNLTTISYFSDIDDIQSAIQCYMSVTYRDKAEVFWNIVDGQRVAICTTEKPTADYVWGKLKTAFSKKQIKELTETDVSSLEKKLKDRCTFIQFEKKTKPSFLLCLEIEAGFVQKEINKVLHCVQSFYARDKYTYSFFDQQPQELQKAKRDVQISCSAEEQKFIFTGPVGEVNKLCEHLKVLEDKIQQTDISLYSVKVLEKDRIAKLCKENSVVLNEFVTELDPHTVDHVLWNFPAGSEVCVANMDVRHCSSHVLVDVKETGDGKGLLFLHLFINRKSTYDLNTCLFDT